MPRRRVFLLALLLLALLAGVPWALRPSDASKITRTNFDRLQTGMSWEEVKGILSEPSFFLCISGAEDSRNVALWENDTVVISMRVDEGGAVCDQCFRRRSPLEILRRVWERRIGGPAPF